MDGLDPNFNAISLKFWQIIGNIIVYNSQKSIHFPGFETRKVRKWPLDDPMFLYKIFISLGMT